MAKYAREVAPAQGRAMYDSCAKDLFLYVTAVPGVVQDSSASVTHEPRPSLHVAHACPEYFFCDDKAQAIIAWNSGLQTSPLSYSSSKVGKAMGDVFGSTPFLYYAIRSRP